MDRLGLGDEQIRAANPRVITVTTSLLGGGGPLSNLAGYGFHAGAIAGFTDLVGWPDLGPDGPWMAYTDTIAPHFLITASSPPSTGATGPARAATSRGRSWRSACSYLAPELLEQQVTGVSTTRNGNRDRSVGPPGGLPVRR